VTGKTSNGHGGRCERAEEREAGEEEGGKEEKGKREKKSETSSMTNHVRGVITFVCHDLVGEGVGEGADEGRERVECVTLCGRGHYNKTRRERSVRRKKLTTFPLRYTTAHAWSISRSILAFILPKGKT
jgi:hypothetical protein